LAILLSVAGVLSLPGAAAAFTCTWTGATSTNWSTAGNWNNCNGTTPQSGDTAIIQNVANLPTLSAAATISGATLNTGATLTIAAAGNLTLAGIMDGDGNLVVAGTLTWNSGTMSGNGTTTINSGGFLALTTGATKTVSRTVNNSGAATISGGSGTLQITSGSVFNNLSPTGTFTVQTDSIFSNTGTFNNSGTFTRNTSAGIVSIQLNFINSGTVNVVTGTLRFLVGTSTHGGTYNFTGADLEFTGGTHTVDGSLTGTDLLIDTAVTFNAAATLSNQVANLEIGGTGTFNTGEALSFQTILQDGGTVGGSDNVSSANWTWSGGTMSGTGTSTIPPGGTLSMTTGATKTVSRTVNNSGAATISGGSGTLQITSGSVFNNLGPGSFLILSDPSISNTGTFNNAGAFGRTSSAGDANVQVVFQNTGSVEVETGTLTFSNFTQTAGSTILSGGDITASTNPLRIQGGTLTGTGTVTGNVLATAAGAVAPGFSPGTVTITGTYTQSAPAAFNAEIDAVGAGNFDVIAVGGQAAIGGVLNVPTLPFTPVAGNAFPLMSYASRVGEFSTLNLPALPGGLSWLTRYAATQFSLRVQALLPDVPIKVDTQAPATGSPNLNQVLDPGENVVVGPRWQNPTFGPISFTGIASNLTGPAGATYTITDGAAGYGTINGNGGENDCVLATGNCYEMSVSNPAVRPALHWDVTFDEALSNGDVSSWTLHVGGSFADVSQTEPFYRFIETLLHNQITTGCLPAGNYCPSTTVTRGQMSVFLLRSRFGAAYVPPPATGTVFADVPISNPFVAFIEDLAARQVTSGCLPVGNYCPDANVTREQMAVFLLRMLEGPTYFPPDCTVPTFNDVPCTSGFARWIEELVRRQITAGCGGGAYCPTNPLPRGQMAVFLTATYSLRLNGP
jgi:hypothetical protein